MQRDGSFFSSFPMDCRKLRRRNCVLKLLRKQKGARQHNIDQYRSGRIINSAIGARRKIQCLRRNYNRQDVTHIAHVLLFR